MGCWPQTIMEIFRLYQYQIGMPVVVVLAIFVAMIIGAIYVRTRSLAHLAVMSIYSFAVFGTMFVNDAYLEVQYHTAMYVITIALATVFVGMILKLVKE